MVPLWLASTLGLRVVPGTLPLTLKRNNLVSYPDPDSKELWVSHRCWESGSGYETNDNHLPEAI